MGYKRSNYNKAKKTKPKYNIKKKGRARNVK
jgi:hypothetical protein